MDDSPLVETIEPEAAFSVLADGSRIDILRALWEADGQEATFSELCNAVGMRDSGKFNYHLSKLRGRFVRKTDDGYELQPVGHHVVGAVLAGGYTMSADLEPFTLEDHCLVCNGDLAFTYEVERAHINCQNCSYGNAFPVPPGAFADYSIDQFPRVANRYVRTLLTHARSGFCSACEGRVGPELTTFGSLKSDDVPPEFADVVAVVYDCDRCGMRTYINLSTALLDHPRVSAFHYDRGVDVRDVPIWNLGTVDGEPQSAMLADEPGTARVTYGVDGHELTLTVDDSLQVVDLEPP